VLIEST